MQDFPIDNWRQQDKTPWMTYEEGRARQKEREDATMRGRSAIARNGRFAAGWAIGATAAAVMAYMFAGVAGALAAGALGAALAARSFRR